MGNDCNNIKYRIGRSEDQIYYANRMKFVVLNIECVIFVFIQIFQKWYFARYIDSTTRLYYYHDIYYREERYRYTRGAMK